MMNILQVIDAYSLAKDKFEETNLLIFKEIMQEHLQIINIYFEGK